ncbi:MAG: c-type cytochrome biogenesis protein CcmI [Sphingomonadaceae bacterium]|nr:c-type cytochrome biogenesis protein CcmI [Sphingomonadaceae bacterium]
MTLWILLTLLAALAAAALVVPLVRRYDRPANAPSAAREVYRDQIAEIDVQERNGSVSPTEAEGLRTEAKRRLLAEDRFAEKPSRPLGGAALSRAAFVIAGLVALGSTLLYSKLGAPGVTSVAGAETAAQAVPSAAGGTDGSAAQQASIEGMVGKLEERLKANPNDVDGWRMLGLSRYSLQQYPAAAAAYAKAVALKPDSGELQSAYGETLVLEAKGTVTPAARSAFQRAVAADPTDPRARYFLGLARDQAGDRKGAIADWIAIYNGAPAGAPWAPGLREVIVAAASKAGVDIASKLKPTSTAAETVAPPPLAQSAGAPGPDGVPAGGTASGSAGGPGATTAGGIPNPSPEQMAAASRLPPSQQQDMIRSMVDRLAARLKSNPQDPEGWLRLMRARMVLGDPQAAAAARREALAALSDASARAQIEQGAKALGVPGA